MRLLPPRRLLSSAVTTALAAAMLTSLSLATPAHATRGQRAATSTPGALGVVSTAQVGNLLVENSFVSSVGWVKPGDDYPSRILLTNTGDSPVSGAQVTVTAPTGTAFTQAGQGAVVS